MDEEELSKRYEDEFFIDQTLIKLVKKNPIIFEDLAYDLAFLKDIDPNRDQKIEEAFNSIASELTNEEGTHYQYVFTGEYISSRWLALLENFKEFSRAKQTSWMFYDDMEFLNDYIDPEELSNEKCSKSMAAADNTTSKNTEPLQSIHNVEVSRPRKSSIPKVYRLKLSNVDLAMIQEVKNYPCLYAGTSGSKTKHTRDAAFQKIAETILDKEYVAENPDAGSELQEAWKEVRRKYIAAVNEGKNIDPFQNSVLKFLKPFMRRPKKKSEMVLAVAGKEKDSQKENVSTEPAAVSENISPNTETYTNPNSSWLGLNSPTSVINLTDERDQNLMGDISSYSKDADENQSDPYEDAIIKAFTTELQGKIQGAAMLRICKKLQDLEMFGLGA